MNILLRRKLERARARERAARLRTLPWREWLEAHEPEFREILLGIARDKSAPITERRAAERALARCYGDRRT